MQRIAVFVVYAVVVLSVWFEGHLYMVRRLVLEPGLGGLAAAAAIVAIALLAVSVLLQPLAERHLPTRYARFVIWPAAVWLGFAFYLMLSLGLSEIVYAFAGVALASPGPSGPTTAAMARATVVELAALGLGGLALVGGLRQPRLERVEIELARWPRALDGFRIVQISDIHIGALLDRRFAQAVTERVNALAPDLIAVTGDLVDGSVKHLGDEVAPFAALRAEHGVFFVTGNHDYYSGADPWLEVVRTLGMRALRNERVEIRRGDAVFDLAGVDDHRGYLFGPGHGEDVARAFAGRDTGRAVVLLAHDPSTFKTAAPLGVDLQLSGHTHGGQFLPWNFFVRFQQPFTAGLARLGALWVYTSRGTGYWGPPKRFGAPSEITRVRLVTA